ncbi:DNA-directed DNA polymerase II small subunit (plasmid) [Halocatena salina]|uniref:DNA polymerase II small subunit n=1 Tax=Halocatena salina TaxID=2934340 RepID=A0A8U0A8L1_9EURY|nr:DNA-directed DNA polymerase II small subunit [Halocatena salina]UPM44363.1 DNA-directed DNA polymerase II small subunit [Halocatena salina]
MNRRIQIVRTLARQGYNADREAVTLLTSSESPTHVIETMADHLPEDTLRVTADNVQDALDRLGGEIETSEPITVDPSNVPTPQESTATGETDQTGVIDSESPDPEPTRETSSSTDHHRSTHRERGSLTITGDVTDESTGTGTYETFVQTFQDRYQRLSGQLRGRLNHRPAETLAEMPGQNEAEMIGLVNDIQSTKNGHWLIELEDTTGTFSCLVMKDREIADTVDELCFDECIGVAGTLSNDGEILFVDSIHFPDIPHTYRPSTADRHVRAALISDVHVGSQEFHAAAWEQFTDWLHTEEAERVEYLLIAGDMVEGVGVYPEQDDELSIVDIYEQYERFSELLKAVPGDMEIVMIPGNHDAVRLAEPQPAFDEELRDIMRAHDAHITGNPSTVTIEGVSVLLYHGVSLYEVIIDTPGLDLEHPAEAMCNLLKKRHVAPQYGGQLRLAPEERDYLVIDEIPDVFHTGHLHKFGCDSYNNVLAVNSGCWQKQTSYQRSQGIDPDVGYAPILDLDTHEMTIRKFTV